MKPSEHLRNYYCRVNQTARADRHAGEEVVRRLAGENLYLVVPPAWPDANAWLVNSPARNPPGDTGRLVEFVADDVAANVLQGGHLRQIEHDEIERLDLALEATQGDIYSTRR